MCFEFLVQKVLNFEAVATSLLWSWASFIFWAFSPFWHNGCKVWGTKTLRVVRFVVTGGPDKRIDIQRLGRKKEQLVQRSQYANELRNRKRAKWDVCISTLYIENIPYSSGVVTFRERFFSPVDFSLLAVRPPCLGSWDHALRMERKSWTHESQVPQKVLIVLFCKSDSGKERNRHITEILSEVGFVSFLLPCLVCCLVCKVLPSFNPVLKSNRGYQVLLCGLVC